MKAHGCRRIFEDVLEDQYSPVVELDVALGSLRPGDTLIVPSLDHFARSLGQLHDRLQLLHEDGAALVSIQEDIDSRGNAAYCFSSAVALLRRFDRAILSDRRRRSLERAHDGGRRGGRKPKLAGKKAAVAQRLLTETDLSVPEIARRVGVSAATLYRHFPDPRGAGRET